MEISYLERWFTKMGKDMSVRSKISEGTGEVLTLTTTADRSLLNGPIIRTLVSSRTDLYILFLK